MSGRGRIWKGVRLEGVVEGVSRRCVLDGAAWSVWSAESVCLEGAFRGCVWNVSPKRQAPRLPSDRHISGRSAHGAEPVIFVALGKCGERVCAGAEAHFACSSAESALNDGQHRPA